MDPNLLRYYNRELRYIRAMGGEFAKEFPKIAGRLGLGEFECEDPYVERLLEGFAFLAARVRLKVDAQFPKFTQHLLEMVYPHFLSPLPSMAVVRMEPDFDESALSRGEVIPRGEELRSLISKEEQTACKYRTAHEVTLWPLKLTEAEYLVGAGAVAGLGVPIRKGVKGGLRIKLETTAGLSFNALSLDRLPIFLQGEEIAFQLYEHLVANLLDVVVRPSLRPVSWQKTLPASAVKGIGFEEDQAMLPYTARSFQGYRLLQEYFALPQRFLFVEISGLQKAVKRCEGRELELIFQFDRINLELSRVVLPSHFALFCTPVINLFPKITDRIHLTHKTNEYHIVPDRNKPLDFEVFQVSSVNGYGTQAESLMEFQPFYKIRDAQVGQEKQAFYTTNREPRRVSDSERRSRPRFRYVGSEMFISLVDADEAPFGHDLKQIGLKVLCTNRDLPLHMPVGIGQTDFSLASGAPVTSIRCVAGPTFPKASPAHQSTSWKLISHLSLNYLSLTNNDREKGAAALRQILSLYGDISGSEIKKQIEGIRAVKTEPVTRRLPVPGPICFGRGLELTIEFDESAFQGSGIIVLGAVLKHFFERYTSINSFTETVITTMERGQIIRWPARIGTRHTL
nr:type VI secretion system baseplate subunit TssF [uncultured Desulfobacter sp.]